MVNLCDSEIYLISGLIQEFRVFPKSHIYTKFNLSSKAEVVLQKHHAKNEERAKRKKVSASRLQLPQLSNYGFVFRQFFILMFQYLHLIVS